MVFRALRKHINPASVLALVALVFAVTGGAYAAGGGNGSGHATASVAKKKPKKKSSSTGKPGPRGPAGPAGPAGATGTAGPAGTAGAQGPAGPAGPAGAAGGQGEKGATGAAGAAGAKGATGATGATGISGFTETLPAGKTETGAWSNWSNDVPASTEVWIPISFAIPLPAASENAYFLNEEETATEAGTGGCKGSVEHPTAPAGDLCVYTSGESVAHFNTSPTFYFGSTFGYEASGTVMHFLAVGEPANLKITGAWAVTAPTS